MEINDITEKIIGSAIKIHRALGPGLLESAYQKCLLHELGKQGLKLKSEVHLPLVYDTISVDHGYRLDILVEEAVIVEVKAVECLTDVHKAQLLTYLRLSDKRVGLLINFNESKLLDGLKRIAN